MISRAIWNKQAPVIFFKDDQNGECNLQSFQKVR